MSWTFISNYGHVLFLLGQDSELTIREIARLVGITERAAQRIIAELVKAGYVAIEKKGRKNIYLVNFDMPLKHPIEKDCTIHDIVNLIVEKKTSQRAKRSV